MASAGCALVADDGRSSQSVFRYVVFYDSEGGFVTGSGWIDSLEGAHALVPSLAGKVTLSFLGQYRGGIAGVMRKKAHEFDLCFSAGFSVTFRH
jgi:hypothetical protein